MHLTWLVFLPQHLSDFLFPFPKREHLSSSGKDKQELREAQDSQWSGQVQYVYESCKELSGVFTLSLFLWGTMKAGLFPFCNNGGVGNTHKKIHPDPTSASSWIGITHLKQDSSSEVSLAIGWLLALIIFEYFVYMIRKLRMGEDAAARL